MAEESCPPLIPRPHGAVLGVYDLNILFSRRANCSVEALLFGCRLRKSLVHVLRRHRRCTLFLFLGFFSHRRFSGKQQSSHRSRIL